MNINYLVTDDRSIYHEAYKFMYWFKKDNYKDKIYDEVNPLQNKQLKTEMRSAFVVAYDYNTNFKDGNLELAKKKSNFDYKKYGRPVGVQSWVICGRNGKENRVIGKQMIVDKDYEGHGICTTMLQKTAQKLKDTEVQTWYIGCSQFSAPIFKYHFGIDPYYANEQEDMYKFNVDKNLLIK